MSFTAGGFLSPSDGYGAAEQQLQYYGESVPLLLSRHRFAAFFFFFPCLFRPKVLWEMTGRVEHSNRSPQTAPVSHPQLLFEQTGHLGLLHRLSSPG